MAIHAHYTDSTGTTMGLYSKKRLLVIDTRDNILALLDDIRAARKARKVAQ